MPSPYKHPKTGVYWFRQRVPADIRAVAKGRTAHVHIGARTAAYTIGAELKVSLGTKDPAQARERASSVDSQFRSLWSTFRNGPVKLSFKNMAALSGELYEATVRRHEENPGPPDIWQFLHDFTDMTMELSATDPQLARDAMQQLAGVLGIEVPDGPLMSHDLEVILQERGVVLAEGDRMAMLEKAIGAQQGAFQRLARNATGDYSPDPLATRFPTFVSPSANPATPSAKVSLGRLFEAWSNRLHRPKPRTVSSYRRVVDAFTKFLGHDDAEAVTDVEIVRWHRALIEAGTVSHETFIRTHKAALGTIYAYGMSVLGGKLVKANPVSHLTLEGPKKAVSRDRGFTEEEAQAILSAALRAYELGTDRMAKHRLDALRWVPWIAAYTGARPGEISQLRRQDLKLVDGVKCFALLPDAGTIKTGRFRNVPIHIDLLNQGIWDFAMASKDGPLFYNAAAKSATPWEGTTGFVGEWVRNTVKVTDEDIGPNHAWRHWFKSKGRSADISDSYLDAICGHAPANEGKRYGKYEAKTLLREIEKLPTIVLRSHNT
jgi:integrase